MRTSSTNLFVLFFIFFLFLAQTSRAHFTTKGPYGGSVTCMLSTDTLIFVGTANGGVFRTTSAAATSWRYANYDGLTNASINSLAAMGRYVFAGTNGGVFKSNNAGNQWAASNSGLTDSVVLSMIVAGNRVLAGTKDGGIFISTDSGNTWASSNTGLVTFTVSGFAYNGTTLFAATSGGIFSSTNGDSWTPLNNGLLNLRTVAVSGNTLFVANADGVFATSLSSINWAQHNQGLNGASVNSLYASNGVVYASTNNGVYQSPDQTIQWTAANADYTGEVKTTVVYNDKLFAGTKEDGIYRSTSLSTVLWKEFNTGLNNLETYAIYNSGTLVLAATNKGLFVSRDLAANYIRSNAGLSDSLHITALVFGGTKLFASTQNAGVFVSADTGTTWAPANSGLTASHIKTIIATNTHILAAAASGEVFVAPLSSLAWELTTGAPLGMVPTALATDGGMHVFLGTQTQGVYMCMDNQTWTASNESLTNLNITSLVVSGSSLYAGTTGGGVFKRPLMGTWSSVNTGLPTQNITALTAAGQWVAAGFKGGVYVTYDQGASWKAPNVMQYLPQYADVTAISFTTLSTRIFAATPYNCLYSNGIAELPTGLRSIQQSIGEIMVSPNPNNGNFTVSIKDIRTSVKDLRVYDITGKEVYNSTSFIEGPNAFISLNTRPGIYFVTIQADKGAISKKIIIE